MKTRFTFFSVLAVFITAAFAPADAAQAVTIIKGPYLQQVTMDSIVIMWETDIPSGSRVDYGEYNVEDSTPVTIHEMLLTQGLYAGSSYTYTVTSGDASDWGTFATAPSAGQSFRFAAYGNTRSNASAHKDVITAIMNSGPDLVLHTGDIVYNGNDYEQWGEQFFGPCYDLMINTPLLPVLGNHEYSSGQTLFFDFFSLPNNEEWFAFTYGDVRFIGLNTNIYSGAGVDYSPGSPQYSWLVSELNSDAYQNATWHIVYFHHPPYTCSSSHSDDTNVQQYLVPLFEQYGVDMVFNGHTHAYERYFHNGIYYIVTGGGGAPLHTLPVDTQEPIRQFGEEGFHHCVIDVTSSSLTLSARYNSGSTFDSITITKTAKASNPNPANSAQNVPVDAVLSWKAGVGAVSHDVYFGTDFTAVSNANDPDEPPGRGSQTATTFNPDTMDYETTYYWRIDEYDGYTTHQGNVWSFTTEVWIPELPWSDGFESGSFATGGWTTSGNANTSSKADYSGIYGAEIKGTAWIEKAISTVGFSNINIKYVRKTKGLDDGEYLYVEWFDGNGWHELEATQDTAWSLQNLPCGAGANDNAAFRLRFSTNASNSAEYAYVDDVEIISEPVYDHDVAVMAITAPISVVVGGTATIEVTVENQGMIQETFNVTLTDTPPDGGIAGAITNSPQTITLYSGDSSTISFSWNTAGATLGHHTLDAMAVPVTGEIDTADNYMSTTSTITEAGATIYVKSIDMSLQQTGKNWKTIARVLISPGLAGATVLGEWDLNGSVIQTGATGVTDSSGYTEITSQPKKAKSGDTFTFTVMDVVASGYTYNPSLNIETSDTITVP